MAAYSEGRGRGSRFVVRLPLRPASTVQAPVEPPVLGRRHCRLLLIEDNDDARESLRTALELGGYEVRGARDGQEGLALARVEPPDVALIDLGLPGVDGFEIARALRAEPATAAATLVAVTGYGQPDDVRRSREAGFDVHLVKPVDADRLSTLLDRLAARERS